MNILVFGKTGQVASELGRMPGVTCLGRDAADLENPQNCADLIAHTDADAIINAAAYTAVDRAEEERALAQVINAQAPTAMAQAAAARQIPFVHISTDYVFDGSGNTPWRADDPTGPLGVYGSSKLAGETGVQKAGGAHAILRTSWVFSAHGNNFVKTMLRLAADRDALTIVGDQIGGPTAAASIAKAAVTIARDLQTDPNKSGVYHFSGAPDVSWADFAREIFSQAGAQVAVQDIPTSAYPTAAQRPANSRLDCTQIGHVFDIQRPDWHADLAKVLTDLKLQ